MKNEQKLHNCAFYLVVTTFYCRFVLVINHIIILYMPQFYNNLPATDKAMKEAKSEYTRVKNLPIGIIGKNNLFAYGWDGEKYYVVEGVFKFFVTKTHLSLDEAKQLFNALSFNKSSEPCSKVINTSIKEARKNKLSGDDLFWFLTDRI